MAKQGKIFVITGPSGSGKTDISVEILNNKKLHINKVVTCTTRPMRQGEIDGKSYFFISNEEFLKNIRSNLMFEWAEVYGNYYGSRKKDVEDQLNTGNNLLFTIDPQGAMKLKETKSNCKTIFIKAESIDELKRRLRGRSTDSEETINHRMRMASDELKIESKFDYVVINYKDKISETVKEVAKIIFG